MLNKIDGEYECRRFGEMEEGEGGANYWNSLDYLLNTKRWKKWQDTKTQWLGPALRLPLELGDEPLGREFCDD